VEPEQPPRASHPVVAVVVCRDGLDDRFDALLRALGDQDHPHLRVQVIDAASTDDPSERIRRTLPEAGVHRLARDPGFSEAANLGAALAAVAQAEAEFLVFCHDDVAPDPGAVRALVDAAVQWDADVVGPKFVDWDDPHRLGQVGLAVDRVGTTLPFVEPGELDQGQHDGVREVFAVPSGFTLVRAARFAAFGGFDGAVPLLGDDLALCWRARATGSRVLVTSEARVRHAAAVAPAVAPAEPGCELVDRALGRAGGGPGSGPPASLLTRLVARHRLRALLTCSGRLDLLRVVPQALVMTLVEAAGGVATGRPGRARATLGAWAWNLARPRSLWRARRRIRAAGRVPDRAVHRMQVRGMVGPRLQLRRLGNRRATRPVTGDLPPHAGPPTGATPAGASGATGEAVEGAAAWTL
jgi:GT2 family glycosyltransferase